jgi:biopolymer transport protein ExbD
MAKKAKRQVQEINASSMADIAFLLLIFFLVTTTFDSDYGIQRKLPEKIDIKTPPPEVKRRNVFLVLVNREDMLLVNGAPGDINLLKEDVKNFILNPNDDPNLSEKKEINSKGFGQVKISKGVVSLQNDRGTSYKKYIEVQNVLAAAFNEMRNERAKAEFNVSYDDLKAMAAKANEDAIKKCEAIEEVLPLSISEAQPKDTRKK